MLYRTGPWHALRCHTEIPLPSLPLIFIPFSSCSVQFAHVEARPFVCFKDLGSYATFGLLESYHLGV